MNIIETNKVVLKHYQNFDEYVRILLGILDIDRFLAEDSVSKAFLKLIEKPIKNINVRSYLIKSAKHIATDHLKKYNKVSHDIMVDGVPEPMCPENRVLNQFLIDDINKATNTLSRSQFSLYQEYFIYGKKQNLIAKEWGESANAITKRVRVIRNQLQNELSEYS